MNDVVIVPSFSRPEFLHVCLERITFCPGIANKTIVVSQDIKPALAAETLAEVKEVVSRFNVEYIECAPTISNNGINCVFALREALAAGAERIYLVEDDVLVRSDCFDFFDRALELYDPTTVTTGCRNRETMNSQFADDPTAVRACLFFRQLACAFTREKLQVLLNHPCIRQLKEGSAFDYQMFEVLQSQNADGFPNLPEPDGFFTIFPFVTRAHHIGYGFTSIPKPGEAADKRLLPGSSLDERIAELHSRFGVPEFTPPASELVLRLDERQPHRPNPGFKLVFQNMGNRRFSKPFWVPESYAKQHEDRLMPMM